MLLVTKFYRGSVVETFHIGYAVAVDEKGNVVFVTGEPEYPIFIRSSAKPFQTVPILESGTAEQFKFSDEEIALMCASHNGEPYHVEVVQEILKKIGLNIDDLLCGAHPPMDKASYEQLILKGRRATAVHNNCSGKHAGMLALAKFLEATLDNYLDPNHPVQQKILEVIKNYSGKDKIPLAIDGCNAPTFFLPLKNIAIMYNKLVQGADDYLRKIFHIMSLHPKLIAGRDRFDTDFIAALSGKGVAKVGADGVRGIGIRSDDGRTLGLAIKVLSGNKEAVDSMTVAVLKHLKLLDEDVLAKLDNYASPVIHNHSDQEVGRVETDILAGE